MTALYIRQQPLDGAVSSQFEPEKPCNTAPVLKLAKRSMMVNLLLALKVAAAPGRQQERVKAGEDRFSVNGSVPLPSIRPARLRTFKSLGPSP
jgi:hypothetical protein